MSSRRKFIKKIAAVGATAPFISNIKAKEKKSRIIFGYEMLLGQAIRSFEIWLDKKAPYEAMKRSILGGFG